MTDPSLFGINLASWPLIRRLVPLVSPRTAKPPRLAPAGPAASTPPPTSADASTTASPPASVSHFPQTLSSPFRRQQPACSRQTASATPAHRARATGNSCARYRAETRRPADCCNRQPRAHAGTALKPSSRQPLSPATPRAFRVPVAIPCRRARSFSIGHTFAPGRFHAGGPNCYCSCQTRQASTAQAAGNRRPCFFCQNDTPNPCRDTWLSPSHLTC